MLRPMIWGRFKRLHADGASVLPKLPMRFHVALGLALHGLNEVAFDIAWRESNKSLWAGGFWKRDTAKPSEAWGIDIGTSGIRVVCVARQADKEGLQV